MILSKKQIEMLLSANQETDFCTNGNKKTMTSLCKHGLARLSSGFGFRFGGIIELTEKGKEEQIKYKNVNN